MQARLLLRELTGAARSTGLSGLQSEFEARLREILCQKSKQVKRKKEKARAGDVGQSWSVPSPARNSQYRKRSGDLGAKSRGLSEEHVTG